MGERRGHQRKRVSACTPAVRRELGPARVLPPGGEDLRDGPRSGPWNATAGEFGNTAVGPKCSPEEARFTQSVSRPSGLGPSWCRTAAGLLPRGRLAPRRGSIWSRGGASVGIPTATWKPLLPSPLAVFPGRRFIACGHMRIPPAVRLPQKCHLFLMNSICIFFPLKQEPKLRLRP